MKRRMLVVLGLVVGLLVGAAPAGAAGSYSDPAGDSGSAGDVTAVRVVSDASSGQILFQIAGKSLSSSSKQATVLQLDSDANPLTGDITEDGTDYWLLVAGDGYDFEKWSGTDWVEAPDSTVQITLTQDLSTMNISINRRELSNTSDFNFFVYTVNLDDKNAGDDAPDDGMYNYSLDAAGPLITGLTTRATPARPRAGKRFVVAATTITLPPDGRTSTTPIAPESYTCTATLNGKRIAGSGKGRCSFAVPKTAKRKTLRVTITVNYQGAKKTKVLVYRVA